MDLDDGPLGPPMTAPAPLDALEAAYLAARDARDRLDVARARGEPPDTGSLEAEAASAEAVLRSELERVPPDDPALSPEDRLARDAIGVGMERAFADDAGLLVAPAIERATCDDPAAWATAIERGGDELHRHLDACYGALAGDLVFDGASLTRPRILGRLATEPSSTVRRRLFLALEPLWRVVDGDAGERSPYRALLATSADLWRRGRSPIAANAVALGVTVEDIEAWIVATLEAWRDAVATPPAADREVPGAGGPAIEPWDWWWLAGAADRAMGDALPLDRVFSVNREVYAALGADLHTLNVQLDTTPRPGRPAVPVAFTTFSGRPFLRPDGSWSPGAPTVLASYVDGGLGELTELVHETGHAIHIAALRTRPAFADWPASDALTEALAELVALDVAEPAWQARWLPGAPAIPVAESLRCRYAGVVLDAAWALFEIRLHADPTRRPNDVWTEITATYLGIASHPEWSWWAIRGQLVQEPGYMANYAIGAVLVADLRASIRDARGDWIDGDPGWYGWVRDHVYRFGLGRAPADVLRDVLGRPPTVDALRAEIARARR